MKLQKYTLIDPSLFFNGTKIGMPIAFPLLLMYWGPLFKLSPPQAKSLVFS